MGIFFNIFFDIAALAVIAILFTQVMVPLWRNSALFPSVRKLRNITRKTKENVR